MPVTPVRGDEHRSPLDYLADATQGQEVRFQPGMPLHIQRLMAALGVKVIFDPDGFGGYKRGPA